MAIAALSGYPQPISAFFVGFLLPLWPLVWYFSSPTCLRRELIAWEKLRAEGVITQAEARLLRQSAIQSVRLRAYGTGDELPSESAKGEK